MVQKRITQTDSKESKIDKMRSTLYPFVSCIYDLLLKSTLGAFPEEKYWNETDHAIQQDINSGVETPYKEL